MIYSFPLNCPSPYENQIDLDINRTFPEDPYFSDKEVLASLKNVLLAFSRRNISIGYCQGFNFLVAKLLKIYRNEEESFWVFTNIIESILPLNYFTNMAGVMIDCGILNRLVKVYINDLHCYLKENNLQMHVNNLIYKWFVSAFITNTSENVAF